MRPDRTASPEFVNAFREIAGRIARSEAVRGIPEAQLPVRMYVAGGAALHFYSGSRFSIDVDAAFSHRIHLPDDLKVSFRDAEGNARLLYFDNQYNDTLALLHENAYDDSHPLELDGIDPRVLDVRILSALDLAVSKISRFSAQDRDDIRTLAIRGLIDSAAVRQRASEATGGYVGNLDRLNTSIELACHLVSEIEAPAGA